jgi:hypothetical protein
MRFASTSTKEGFLSGSLAHSPDAERRLLRHYQTIGSGNQGTCTERFKRNDNFKLVGK